MSDAAVSYTEEVPDALDHERVDRLVCFIADVSRNEAANLVESGLVLLNGGVVVKGSKRVCAGSTIEVEVPARSTTLIADETIDVPVVYEDKDILVVDKPAGLVVHPGSGIQGGTMVNGLVARYPDLRLVGEPHRPGVVHRLDKDTTGLLMVARTQAAYADLVLQLKQRLVRREYSALVFGTVDSDSGTIDAPLGRSERDATRQAVVIDGRSAVTHYEVGQSYEIPEAAQTSGPMGRQTDVTSLSCRLETGRTHQIRVHLSSIGYPIVGDTKYGGRTNLLDRPFLHAAVLGFVHPSSGEELSFCSDLPSKLQAFLSTLNEH